MFLTSIPHSFQIHFNIILTYITATWISKRRCYLRENMNNIYCTNMFLTSIPHSFQIHFNIILTYITATWISKRRSYLRENMNNIYCTVNSVQSCWHPHIHQMLRNWGDLWIWKRRRYELWRWICKQPGSRIVVMWRLLQRRSRGVSGAVK